ncbi:MAG: hypothetical protein C4K49_04855 [Candidatus Thorarchaeota archaeon]|nr:MAG: hypothetical protein C4K49_04855 [Candidatus Thorarchaeota archaeon]
MNTKQGCIGPIRLHVDVPLVPRGYASGVLTWTPEGPTLKLGSGQLVQWPDQNARYGLHERVIIRKPSVPEANPLPKMAMIRLNPVLIARRQYSPCIVRAVEDIYPPSTYHWKSRLVRDGIDAVFAVQTVEGSDLFWLTIFDSETGSIYESHEIHSHEIWVIGVREDWEIDQETERAVAPSSPDLARLQALKVLDGLPPSWKRIAALTEGVAIPGLHRGETMREFMDQLVPSSFPPNVREELMVFLAWVTRSGTPNRDPVEFLQKLSSMSLLWRLCAGHFRCILDGVSSPPYVKVFNLAANGHLKMPRRAPPVAAGTSASMMIWYKLAEQFPDWRNRPIQFAKKLNDSGAVVTKLPVSKSEAHSSAKAWGDRLAILSHGLLLRTYVNPEPIGLHHIVYVGRAHGWPHKHLAWSARLEGSGGIYPHVDLMVMPQTAVERVRRQRIRLIESKWSTRATNLRLFDERRRQWVVSTKRIVDSLDRHGSMQLLTRDFGGSAESTIQPVTGTESKALDAVSGDMYLTLSESNRYWSYVGLDRKVFQATLTSLRDRGVVRLQYGTVLEGVATVFAMAQGPADRVCSLARSLLLHAPSTLVEMADDGGICLAMLRIPEMKVHELTASMLEAASDSEVRLSCSRVISYTGYMRSLYRRLLRPDGTWDDDVSAMLSQQRTSP